MSQFELMLQRGQLLERISNQRVALASNMVPVQSALRTTDRVVLQLRSGVATARRNPWPWIAAAGALAVLKPRRVWRVLRLSVKAWQGWRALQGAGQRLSQSGPASWIAGMLWRWLQHRW
jgi:hypothetical protein